eukprot:CAMPEP_0115022346 /NCGR_PEP_ID=MMETSP0216-20121206/31492_1 /TAXON_ID=223996 /ORGANISM="Protocruzia adherens, Strain Boccale" /LENGTH=277 /DNA_ID=CAMNT_0002395005 /DNA_START=399 /DNA_END=1232 /DNA_ORIENTATION=+
MLGVTFRVQAFHDDIFFVSNTFFGLISNNVIQWAHQVLDNCSIVVIDAHDNIFALAIACGGQYEPPFRVANYVVTVNRDGYWIGPESLILPNFVMQECAEVFSPYTLVANDLHVSEGVSMEAVLPDGLSRDLVVSKSESVTAEVDGMYLLRQGVPGPLGRCGNGVGIGASVTVDLGDVEALRTDCEFAQPNPDDLPDGISWSGSPLPASSIVLDTCLSKWNGEEITNVQFILPVFCSYGAWTSYISVSLIFSPQKEYHDEAEVSFGNQTKNFDGFLG